MKLAYGERLDPYRNFHRLTHSEEIYTRTGCKYCHQKMGWFKRFLFNHVILAKDVICTEHYMIVDAQETVDEL